MPGYTGIHLTCDPPSANSGATTRTGPHWGPPPSPPSASISCSPPIPPAARLQWLVTEIGYDPADGTDPGPFTQQVAERLHAADPRWGRRINSTGPISDDTVAYRVGTSPVNPLSIDIVLAAHTTHARLQWHTYDHWAETPGAHPTISRHIPGYPGISRILFLFAGTKAAARPYRRALGLSQSAFAAQLNVPLETYRPWDAGRREPPPQLLTRARTLAGYPDETVLLPLPVLALMIGVHVRTLHAAARSGRLGVAYDTRTTFRRLRPRATLKHALDFRRHYYGTQRRPPATPVPLTWASVPEDYDVQLKALRRHLDISQAGFARLVGAARKAVVYQWEARKRCPSPVFWARIQAISTGVASERET